MEIRPWVKHYDHDVPSTMQYPDMPVQSMFQAAVKKMPDKPALHFFGADMTYGQLNAQVLRMANALGRLGIKKGDHVGVHLPNSPQYVIAYLSILYLGAVVVNINPLYTQDEIKLILVTTKVETLISFDLVMSVVQMVAKEVGLKRIVITKVTDYINGFGTSTAVSLDLDEGWHHFSELITSSTETQISSIAINPKDTAMIQFTGGTTGVPKGALLTHANIVAATFCTTIWGAPYIKTIPKDRLTVLCALPYFHVYGNIVGMNFSFLNCATQILIPRFQIDELMGIIANFEKIDFFPADLPQILVPHVKLGFRHFLFLNSGTPLALEDGNSKNCVA
jgi:long-chain acyl-CoA synthetase